MNNSSTEKLLVFLLGAGFSRDAACEAGNPLVSGQPAKYPLVIDLLDRCFGKAALPTNTSIEDLFQDSIDKNDRKPVEALCEVLMEADYYITPHLKLGGSHEDNVYLKFLNDFTSAPLLSFNYDSLPEILLLSGRSWCPMDGYGVPVQARQITIRRGAQPVGKSLRPVLHLHGSICVYPATFYIEKRPKPGPDMMRFDRDPKFLFDPDKLGHCFVPFEGIHPGVTYIPVVERIIAPIPNKAKGLKGEFISEVYRNAIECMRSACQIIAIGYSFNQNDHSSYSQLLAAVGDKPILLVAPDADVLIEHLVHEHPNIEWEAQSMSFKEWVQGDYPGVQK